LSEIKDLLGGRLKAEILRAKIVFDSKFENKEELATLLKKTLKNSSNAEETLILRVIDIQSDLNGLFKGSSRKINNLTFELSDFIQLFAGLVSGTNGLGLVVNALDVIFKACSVELNNEDCFVLVSLPKDKKLKKEEAFLILEKDFEKLPVYTMNRDKLWLILKKLENLKVLDIKNVNGEEEILIKEKVNISYSGKIER
jgi:hypothetical protein